MQPVINYNPDVLTCLANLSNDEVFTPPTVVNDMLNQLPNELWSDKNATFLDPVCKTGVFLREIALRLNKGLEKEIPDQQERLNHIYTKQLFGLGLTELTSLLSRRSVYCTKTANGKYSICTDFNDEQGNIRYKRTEHTWKNGRCIYCGASEAEYSRDDALETYAYQFIHTNEPAKLFNDMKFDVIIGNPPYQLSDGGYGTSAKPIYQLFVEQAKKLNPRFLSLIIPARWYSGGKGLNSFRDSMLKDNRLRYMFDYHDAADCFPGVEVKGGICYFLWERDNRGTCSVESMLTGYNLKKSNRKLDENDIFIRFNEITDIIKKVNIVNNKSVEEIVSSRKPFGFSTNFTKFSTVKNIEDITIYAQNKIGFISRCKVPDSNGLIDKYKVLISKAYNGGYTFPHQIINKPFIPENPSCCTETYLVIGPFKNKQESKNFVTYAKTKFFRSLVLARKITQDNTKDKFRFVPMQDFSEPWTDEKLYKKYKLTKDEIAFIDSLIRPME